MITLGIESATTVVGVALAGDDGVIGSVEINGGRRHAEVLTPAIEFVCHHAQIDIADIGAIAVDIGPGLFTGMRVGVATAKALGHALQVPVVGVSSLELLAHPLQQQASDADRVIASVIDARKGEVFYAFFTSVAGHLQQVSEPHACSVADFNADVLARGQACIAIGDGAWRYRDELEPGIEIRELAHPSAVALVQIGRPLALTAEADGITPDVQPLYLRAPDAVINWSSR
ncbi:MAG: tRNA (adenosine(37)-N6)-threonylcarbamoyltransferase complex dimerization subunit type 1 TsaB [Ilumatobacteraceae bacterium]